VLEREAYFHQQVSNSELWDAGGSPVRKVKATFVPDLPLAVIGRPAG
jgi:hypothetical protein